MNAVWNSYGQLCGCPEIFKKSCKFFCRELDIRVAQVMEPDVFRADGLQNFIVSSPEGVRVIHSPGLGRWTQIRVARMLFVLGNQ